MSNNNKRPAFRAISLHKREAKDIIADIGATAPQATTAWGVSCETTS